MNNEIESYNRSQNSDYKRLCGHLAEIISKNLVYTTSKIWHGHPVWFINDNPIVGYSVLKSGARLMFWSGADFNEPDLNPGSGKFMDASITYTSEDTPNAADIERWLKKSEKIQWDYKNIVKRKGNLEKLSPKQS